MAGAYCNFCGRRCFVYREVILVGQVMWSGHMATCPDGKAHDQQVCGRNADTAHNPLAPTTPAPPEPGHAHHHHTAAAHLTAGR